MRIILEFSEFEHERLTNVDGGKSSANWIADPHLSYNAPFRAIDLGKEALLRFNAVMNSIMMDNTLYNSKTGMVKDIERISDLCIQRVINVDGVNIDIFISFKYDTTEYYGVIRKYNSFKPKFESELYHNLSFTIEQKIKIEGIMIKAINSFLMIHKGLFITIKEIEVKNKNTGNILVLPKNSKVEILNSTDNEIFILYKSNQYVVNGITYYYLNYYLNELPNA